MDHISLILVHYNAETETLACLESLAQLQAKSFEYQIIVLDNASKQALVLPPHLQSLPVEILRSETNLGFTGGNNLAIKHALETYQSAYVLLLNNDTIVSPTFLEKMYQDICRDPSIGLLNPLIYFTAGHEYHQTSYTAQQRGQVFWFAGGSLDWLNLDAFHRGIDEVDYGQFDQIHETDFATGCCVLIPRKVLELVGGLDDRYFLYLEDVDWSLRVVRHGFILAICPAARIWHTNAGSTGGAGSAMHQYYQTRNRLWLTWRYGGWRTRLTVARLASRYLQSGTIYERKAVYDLVRGALGKQPVV